MVSKNMGTKIVAEMAFMIKIIGSKKLIFLYPAYDLYSIQYILPVR
jgi:hypothetical protein